ncbi:uracil-DNA glycosylase-like protein [Pholiota molesta]|nr:uracil-DNA glycosylase-like protein [Pholiota molesta]
MMNGTMEVEAYPDENTDDEHPSNIEEAPSPDAAAKPNPFLKFAFQSPRRSAHSPAGRTTSQSPVALGKRKETPIDIDAASRSDLKLADGTRKATLKRENSSSRGSKKVKTYEHLRPLNDNLAPGLDIIFCGINPGEQSARIGHHFGNPRNHFWCCLHESGLASRKLDPREDYKLPEQFSIGLTNLVPRPTVEQSELSRKEQVEGVPQLLRKITQYQPRVVCFVGLGIADIVRSKVVNKEKNNKLMADVGLQAYKMVHSPNSNPTALTTDPPPVTETLFYAVSSTSGRVVRYQKTDKVQQFKNLQMLTEQLKKGDYRTTNLEIISNPTHVDTHVDSGLVRPSGTSIGQTGRLHLNLRLRDADGPAEPHSILRHYQLAAWK